MSEPYFDIDGSIHLEGPPEDIVVTNRIRPELKPGEEKEFDLEVALPEGLNRIFKIIPQTAGENDPKDFVRAEIRALNKTEEGEELWELVDPEGLVPRKEEALLRVLGNFVADPNELPERQKGIRSRKLWLYLGGAAAAGATIALSGIIVKRRRQVE